MIFQMKKYELRQFFYKNNIHTLRRYFNKSSQGKASKVQLYGDPTTTKSQASIISIQTNNLKKEREGKKNPHCRTQNPPSYCYYRRTAWSNSFVMDENKHNHRENVPNTSPPEMKQTTKEKKRKKNMRKPDCLDVRLHWRHLIVSMHERWDNVKKKEPFRTWWR